MGKELTTLIDRSARWIRHAGSISHLTHQGLSDCYRLPWLATVALIRSRIGHSLRLTPVQTATKLERVRVVHFFPESLSTSLGS